MTDLHEIRVLLSIVGERWGAARSLAEKQSVDPERFAAVAREADVHPWIHALLDRPDRVRIIGERTLEKLAVLRRKVASDNVLLLARLEEALDLLSAERIAPILLKGSDFLHRLYGRFDERTLDDVDLLIRPDQVEPALRALVDHGWKVPGGREWLHWARSSHHVPTESPGPVPVDFEIHWSLVQERRYRLDPRELFARAEGIEISGRKGLRLEDHDAVAHLLLHHVSHYFDRRLKWAVDLAFLSRVPGFRWEIVADRVTRWGGTQAAGMALVHLRRLAPHAVPQDALDRLPVARWRLLATAPLRSRHPLELFVGTRHRTVQKYLATVLLERARDVPAYLWHRIRRESLSGASPVERPAGSDGSDPHDSPADSR